MNGTPPSILIIDDSEALVSSVGTILKHNNYQVDFAYNGSDALRKIQTHAYDVVLCDIDMPGMSGLEFLEKIRKDEERLDVILMTGFLEPEYFIKAIRLGASDFISKPIEFQQLSKSISTVLEKNEARNSLDSFLNILSEIKLDVVINPLKFSQHSVNRICSKFLEQNIKLPPVIVNELLICVDEMVYNAFIHGTLGLTVQQRQGSHAMLQETIASKLKLPQIAVKRIRFSIGIDQELNLIKISVEDDGDGFDYEGWRVTQNSDNLFSLDEHGRGLAVLYHLADEVSFANGGRRVHITKKLSPDFNFGS